MVNSITTSLEAALKRATANIMDDIAVEGLQALRRILEEANFSDSEFLNGYRLFVHVSDSEVVYEILLSGDAFADEDQVQEEAEFDEKEAQRQALLKAYRTYGLTRDSRPIRYSQMRDKRKPAKDARKPAKDARTPARDARKGAAQRLEEHEIALQSPRSLDVDKLGKLRLNFKRSVRQTTEGMQYPQKSYDGLIGKFVEELKLVIQSSFTPVLETVIARYT